MDEPTVEDAGVDEVDVVGAVVDGWEAVEAGLDVDGWEVGVVAGVDDAVDDTRTTYHAAT